MKEYEYQINRNPFLFRNPFCAYIFMTPNMKHSHDFFEISISLQYGKKVSVNDVDIDFNYGTCIITRPKDYHEYKCISKKLEKPHHVDIYVTFNKMKEICSSISSTMFNLLQNEKNPIVFHISSTYMNLILQQVDKLISFSNADIILSQSLHTTIVSMILSNYIEQFFYLKSFPSIPSWINALVTKLSSLEYMNMPIPKIAKEIGYSPEYLSREFHKHMNITLKQFITKKKMEYAYTILSSNDIKIIELAQILGYSNPSNFSKSFYSVFKTTPQNCKKNKIELLSTENFGATPP